MARMPNWEKKADDAWKKVIKQVGHCEMCGSSDKQLHAHHIIGRVNKAYRHDLSSGICLCANCHTFAPYSAHKDASGFRAWLKKNRPGQWQWYVEHTVMTEILVGNRTVERYGAIKMSHRGDEVEYQELKQMLVKEK